MDWFTTLSGKYSVSETSGCFEWVSRFDGFGYGQVRRVEWPIEDQEEDDLTEVGRS